MQQQHGSGAAVVVRGLWLALLRGIIVAATTTPPLALMRSIIQKKTTS